MSLRNFIYCSPASIALLLQSPAAMAHSVEEEAQIWFENSYAADYISGVENFFDHYSEYVYFVSPENAHVYRKDDLITFLDKDYLSTWAEKGLSQIELLEMKTTALGPNTVNIRAKWRLENDRGESVAHCRRPAWNYILNKRGGTWLVIAEVQAAC